ncbi:MAG TPA: alpha-amylase, partial [Candidatus Syntrophosphaera thermopropionivorans]|nr:alpha-amylase [Candidatus Syntrophosphaera thermopropionivorans]
YNLINLIRQKGDEKLLEIARKLSTSDHFYYMCTKYFQDGDVHKYFSPYDSPDQAYIYYMNALADLEERLQ